MEIFVDGVPRKVTPADIRRWHLASFPMLSLDENTGIIEEAIEAVYAIFTGLPKFYDHHPTEVWYEKTLFMARMLVCWYIANMHPTLLAGQDAMGGTPLRAKKIGPITLTYASSDGVVSGAEDILAGLKSNSFGNVVYTMIKGSKKRLHIGGPR